MTFKNFLKKPTVAIWISLATFVIALIAFIVYLVNGASAGYFEGTTSAGVVWLSVLALAAEIATIVLAQFHFAGIVGKIVGMAADVLVAVVPVLLMAALLTFVSSRVQGLSYIFGADANTLAEIQTVDNIGSANTAILGFVLYAIAFLGGAVAAFFKLPKDVTAKSDKPLKA